MTVASAVSLKMYLMPHHTQGRRVSTTQAGYSSALDQPATSPPVRTMPVATLVVLSCCRRTDFSLFEKKTGLTSDDPEAGHTLT